MKFTLGYILLIVGSIIPENIYEINSLKEQAEYMHAEGLYSKSLIHYKALVEVHKNKEPEVLINYAHVLLLSKDSLTARGIYNLAIKNSKKPELKSVAYAQAALIEYQFNKNKTEAIKLLQLSLKENDNNKIARHNLYMLLKLKQAADEEEHTNDKTQRNKSSQGDSDPEGDNTVNNVTAPPGEGANEGTETSVDNFQQMDMSIDKARQLLDVMQKNEIQYIQQLRKKEEPSEKHNLNKPSW